MTGNVRLDSGDFGVSAARQPKRRSGKRPKADGIGVGLSKSGSRGRFPLILSSIWGMSVKMHRVLHFTHHIPDIFVKL
jgi:hypothetical protein